MSTRGETNPTRNMETGEFRALDTERAEAGKEHETILENVVFNEAKRNKDGDYIKVDGHYIYESPAKDVDSKMIELSPTSVVPEPGVTYKVRVLRDTKPNQKHKGKLIVEIIHDDSSGFTLEESWEDAQAAVDLATEAVHQGSHIGRELYKQTGVPVIRRSQMNPHEFASEAEVSSRQAQRIERLAVNEQELAAEVDSLMGTDQRKALATEQRRNLTFALRAEHKIEDRHEELMQELQYLHSHASGDGKMSIDDLRRLKEIRKEFKELEVRQRSYLLKMLDEEESDINANPTGPGGALSDEQKSALQKIAREREALKDQPSELIYEWSPEAYLGVHLRQLKSYQSQLEGRGFVELRYSVEPKIRQVLATVSRGKPILLHGPQGTGKSEVAKLIARKYLNHEPTVIAGSREIDESDLIGGEVLEGDGHGGTRSKKELGPIQVAQKEGAMVILDEVNGLSETTLLSLNDELTMRPGKRRRFYDGSEGEIKEGYCLVMSANLNRQGLNTFQARNRLDASYKDRVDFLEFDYPEQETSGDYQTNAGEGNEGFQLLLVLLMDRKGNIAAPADTLDKVWYLAQASRVLQDAFIGKGVSKKFDIPGEQSLEAGDINMESPLTLRTLSNVLESWQNDGFQHELDYYLWQNYLSRITSPIEKAYVFQVLRSYNFFPEVDGWNQKTDYAAAMHGAPFEVEVPENETGIITFFDSSKVVEAAFGSSPQRRGWPKGGKKKPDSGTES